mgnify:FL=1
MIILSAVSGHEIKIDIPLYAPFGAKLNHKGLEKMDLHLNDRVELKKQHPCGSREWEVLRIGADFRLKCAGCGHQIMIARRLVEKNLRDIKRKA